MNDAHRLKLITEEKYENYRQRLLVAMKAHKKIAARAPSSKKSDVKDLDREVKELKSRLGLDDISLYLDEVIYKRNTNKKKIKTSFSDCKSRLSRSETSRLDADIEVDDISELDRSANND